MERKGNKTDRIARLVGAEYKTRRGRTVVNQWEKWMKTAIIICSLVGICCSLVGLSLNHRKQVDDNSLEYVSAQRVTMNFVSKGLEDENGGIYINDDNFPDETFRDYIQKTADLNYDRVLSPEEALNVLNIILSNEEKLKNVSGIEYFKNLEYLSIVNSNVSKIDISALTKLKTLRISGTKIGDLDLSNNGELVTLEINNMQLNKITMPEVSQITTIKSYNTNIKCETEKHIFNSCKIKKET